jgi:hypothetical protein
MSIPKSPGMEDWETDLGDIAIAMIVSVEVGGREGGKLSVKGPPMGPWLFACLYGMVWCGSVYTGLNWLWTECIFKIDHVANSFLLWRSYWRVGICCL